MLHVVIRGGLAWDEKDIVRIAEKNSKKGEVAGRMDEASSVFAVLVSVDMGGDWDIRYL